MRGITANLAVPDEHAGVIEYAAAPTDLHGWSLAPLFIALSVPAIAAVFAPLVLGTSPAHEIMQTFNALVVSSHTSMDPIWVSVLALGFLLAFPIFGWQLRLTWGRPGRTEIRIASVVATIMTIPVVCVPIAAFAIMYRDRSGQVREDEILSLVAILLTLATLIVGWWLARRVARSATSGHAVTALLLIAYVANAWLPLIAVTELGFKHQFGITLFASGYLLTLASVTAFICQLVLMTTRPWPARISFRAGRLRRR